MRITTTAHAMACGLYLLMVIVGTTWAIGAASMTNVVRLYGPAAPVALGLTVGFAAVLGLLCALTSHLMRRPDSALVTEAVCAAVCAAGFGLYWFSILGKAATTEWLTGGLVIICLARVAQIAVELRRIRHADR